MKNYLIDIILKLKDLVTNKASRISSALNQVGEASRKASSQTERLSGICDRIKFPDLNAHIQYFSQLGDSIGEIAQKGIGFEQSMADLSSITGIVGDDLSQMEERAREVGVSSGLGAEGAARAYALLASQIQVDSIGMEGLNVLLDKSVTLAQASGMEMDAAANALAGTINQFGLSADEADRVINVLAAGSKYGAAEIEELSQSFKVVGSAASAMGLDVEGTAGVLEVLSKANLKGSEAGTALRNIILKLTTELGMDLGEIPLSEALGSLKPKLQDAAYLSKLFGVENIAAAQFLIQNAEAVGVMTEQLTGTTVAQEQAATRTETTAQKMAVLRATADDIKIGITGLLGSFAPLAVVFSENAASLGFLLQGAQGLWGMMTKLNGVVKILTGSTILQNAASIAATAAARAWSAVQIALNAVMSANPLAMVVLAIGALVAAFVAAYNNCEGFRKICDRVWGTVKTLATTIWDFLVKAFEKVSTVIQTAWKWVKKFFGIDDEKSAKAATAAIDKETDAINANTNAKKKNANANGGKYGVDADSSGGLKIPVQVESNPGSLDYLKKQLDQLKREQSYKPIDIALSYDAKIIELENTIASIEDRMATHKFLHGLFLLV